MCTSIMGKALWTSLRYVYLKKFAICVLLEVVVRLRRLVFTNVFGKTVLRSFFEEVHLRPCSLPVRATKRRTDYIRADFDLNCRLQTVIDRSTTQHFFPRNHNLRSMNRSGSMSLSDPQPLPSSPNVRLSLPSCHRSSLREMATPNHEPSPPRHFSPSCLLPYAVQAPLLSRSV